MMASQDPGADQPHQRRRRLPAVRLAICDAHLGRSDEAQQLPADHGRRDLGRAGAECAGLGRPDRQPAGAGAQELNATVSVQSRLQTPEQFGAIRLKTGQDGSVVRLRDVARVELGAENYGFSSNYNGHPATAAVIRLAPGANALKTIGEVKAKIAEIAKQFPSDVKVIYPWDTTPFVKVSLRAGRRDPVRGDGPRLPGHAPVPAEHPRDADPDHRDPGRAAGHAGGDGHRRASASTR